VKQVTEKITQNPVIVIETANEQNQLQQQKEGGMLAMVVANKRRASSFVQFQVHGEDGTVEMMGKNEVTLGVKIEGDVCRMPVANKNAKLKGKRRLEAKTAKKVCNQLF
jgi:hypothetical protein